MNAVLQSLGHLPALRDHLLTLNVDKRVEEAGRLQALREKANEESKENKDFF